MEHNHFCIYSEHKYLNLEEVSLGFLQVLHKQQHNHIDRIDNVVFSTSEFCFSTLHIPCVHAFHTD